MIVFLNGRFVPEEKAVVSVFDRGFLYGDGLFEAAPVVNGRLFRWEAHFERLRRGADYIGLRLPYGVQELGSWAVELAARNELANAFLRLVVSRGVGPRGYSPRGAGEPTVAMVLYPMSATDPSQTPGWKLITSNVRLPANEQLAQFKTCNKLPQILARAEADAAGADEALLLNTDGYVVESSSGNLFWIDDGRLWTPPLASGILAGVTRAVLFEVAAELRLTCGEARIAPGALANVEGVFLSMSSLGVAEALALDGRPLRRSALTQQLRAAYQELVARETR